MVMVMVILALAAFWITRFITVGKFPLVAIPREAFVRRWGVYTDEKRIAPMEKRAVLVRGWLYLFGGQWRPIASYEDVGREALRTNLVMKSLAYLIECDWCTGAWIAAAVVAVHDFYGSVPMPGWAWL